MNDIDVLVVGAGFNGLYQLHRLRQEGFTVKVVDAASAPGGVWYWNCYPGSRVDSHIPNYEFSMPEVWRDWTWSEKFPGQPELAAYFNHVVEVLDLADDLILDTTVTAAHFDATTDRWSVETVQQSPADGGTRLTFHPRFVLLCTGFAAKPFVPALAGLDDFEGDWYHTARWPQPGTGDDPAVFAGRRVGVIGTGASGVQVVQVAAQSADQVTVFQRTPVTALAMQQEWYTDPDGRARLEAAKADYPEFFAARNSPPGSFGDLARLDVSALAVDQDERDRVFERAWAAGGFNFWAATFADVLTSEAANRTAYDFWRAKVWERVADPQVAELLAPAEPPYPFGTKRPSLEQDYYDVFNQDNVSLIDVKTDPIQSITPTGVATGSTHHDIDLLVLATGFDANTGGLTQMDIVGRDGATFDQYWSDGVALNLGMAAAGFPNLFFLYGPLSPTAFCNGPTCAELQGERMVEMLAALRDEGHTRIESTEQADRAWADHCDAVADSTLFGQADSWYMGANVPGKRRQLLNYPLVDAYLDRLAAIVPGGFDGFELSGPNP